MGKNRVHLPPLDMPPIPSGESHLSYYGACGTTSKRTAEGRRFVLTAEDPARVTCERCKLLIPPAPITLEAVHRLPAGTYLITLLPGLQTPAMVQDSDIEEAYHKLKLANALKSSYYTIADLLRHADEALSEKQ